ncbi:DUF2891 domain-containing protein [Zunongwangia sp. HGR-M22]|uniref:DUF2891 domain-containing protein n=1 Tax=Zunongwangia sp. HGR-M22 TaxID=3015168 RepID=UPI0022DE2C75|nr:DUF2891 domain-containing protein [Zunongwangia sp. HGR-M22]WBL26866.1 DUF2891 domain-containing protein [Zunongwangia sp. HGR-M22]
MKKIVLVFAAFSLFSCKKETASDPEQKEETSSDSLIDVEAITETINPETTVEFTLEEANRLAELPLECVETQYPNKLSQTLENAEAMGEPKELHPAFFGCFDWHSSVHGHWSLVALLKRFPNLDKADEIREKLKASLTSENIKAEVDYFKRPQALSYERTYGWAWLLKLAEELKTWDDPMATQLDKNLQPLTDLIVSRYLEFLPKLNYPIRVGEHTNTAFGLGFAYDYALAANNRDLQEIISKRAKDFYLKDDNCPIAWEPSGYDFFSPCLEEVDIMRRIMPKNAFFLWIEDFMPELMEKDFSIEVGEVSDRSDGKLVHLDGLNFSRAWVFNGLADTYPEKFGHLSSLAENHLSYSFPNLVGDSYEGGHWLGTFAIYALSRDK